MMVMSVDWSCDVLFGLLRRDGKLDAVCRLFFSFGKHSGNRFYNYRDVSYDRNMSFPRAISI